MTNREVKSSELTGEQTETGDGRDESRVDTDILVERVEEINGLVEGAKSFIDENFGTIEAEEMMLLVGEADSLRQNYLKRLGDILKFPVLKYREMRDKKRVEALAIPDNPKIIAEIKKRLAKLREKVKKRQDVFEVDSRDEYLTLAEMYRKARKVDKDKFWSGVSSNLSDLGQRLICQSLEQDDILTVLSYYDTYDDHVISSEEFGIQEKIVKKIIEPYLQIDFKPQEEVDFELLREKSDYVAKVEGEVSAILGVRPELNGIKDRRMKEFKGNIFSSKELQILTWSTKKFDKVKRLKGELRRKFIAQEQSLGEESENLLEEPELEKILDFYGVFENAAAVYNPKYRSVILDKIMKQWPDVGELRELFTKIQNDLNKKDEGNGAEQLYRVEPQVLYTLLTVAARESGGEILKKFNLRKAQGLSLVQTVGGEGIVRYLDNERGDANLVDFSDYFREWITKEEVEGLTVFVEEYQTSLSPRFKNGVGSYSSGGPLLSVYYDIGSWCDFVKALPKDYRHKLMELSAADDNRPPNHWQEKLAGLDWQAVDNFLEYNQLCPVELRLGIGILFVEQNLFNGEKWSQIKAAMDKVDPQLIDLLIKKGKASVFLEILDNYSDRANEITGIFCKNGDDLVRVDDYHGDIRYQKQERDSDSLGVFFKLVKICQELLAGDNNLNLEFLKNIGLIDVSDQKIISLILSEKIDLAGSAVDLKLLEGQALLLQTKLEGNSSTYGKVSSFKKFRDLPREQKIVYLELNKFYRFDSDVERIIESGKSQAVLELIRKRGIKFSAEAMLLMVDHLECVPLFYYVKSEDYSAIDKINKLLALHNAGLDDFFGLSEMAKMTAEYNMYGDGDYERFWRELMKWEIDKLVAVANAFAGEEKISLDKLMEIHHSEKFSIQQLINRVKLYLVTEDTEYLWGGRSGEESDQLYLEDESEEWGKVFLTFEKILDRELTWVEKKKFFFGDGQMMSQTKLNFLRDNPRIFRLFIEEEKTYGRFYDYYLELDKNILEDERFWKYKFDSDCEIVRNPALMGRYLALRDEVAKSKIKFDCKIETLTELEQAEKILYLLKIFPTGNVEEYSNINFQGLLNCVEKYGEEATLEGLRYSFSVFEMQHEHLWRVMDFVMSLDTKQKKVLTEIKELVGQTLPLDFINDNKELFFSGKNANEVIAEIESGVKLEKDFRFGGWAAARRQGVLKKVIAEIPISLKGPLNRYFGGYDDGGMRVDKPEDIKLEIGESICNLSPQGKKNLERLSGLYSEENRFYLSINAALLFESDKFAILINWFEAQGKNSEKIGVLLSTDREKLVGFLSTIDEETLKRFSQMPDYLYISLFDAPVFFKDPIAEKVIDYAKKMRGLFEDQKDFKLSVYDLLLADFTEDWESLQKIENNSFFGLTNEVLKSLITDEGEFKEIAQKTLAFTGESRKIEIEVMLNGLERLNPDLRKLILYGLINTYGVKFLANEALIKTKFNLSNDEWLAFVKEVCDCNNYRIDDILAGNSELNFSQEVWGLLLTDTRLGLNMFLRRFKGDTNWAWDLVLRNTEKLNKLFSNNESGTLFAIFKDLPDFWDFILKEHCTELFQYWDSILPGFMAGQKLAKLIEQCLTSPSLLMCGQLIEKYSQGKVVLTVEQIQALAEGSLSDQSAVNPIPILLLHFDGKIVLTLEQLKSSVDLSLRNNFSLDFSRPEIKKLFEERFLEILKQKPVELKLVGLILGKLNVVNSLDEKYFDTMRDIADNEFYTGDRDVSLEGLIKSFETLVAQEDNSQGQESAADLKMSKKNWLPLLLTFMDIEEAKVSPEIKEKITLLFKGEEAKDFCLAAVQEQWNEYLKSAEPKKIPLALMMIIKQIDISGAGPLSQLEALGGFIYTFYQTINNNYRIESELQQRIIDGELSIENRFKKGRSTPEDRSDYYHISRDVVSADPSLFAEFLNVFDKLSPTQFKQFVREVYPLYRAQLTLLKNNGRYTPTDLAALKENIQSFGKNVEEKGSEAFTEVKDFLIAGIKKTFKEKFGIIKIPDNFSEEATRTLTNFSVYLGNLHNKTSDKEAMLGFYLALSLNGQWEKFRRGEEIDVDEYLTPEKGAPIKEMLTKRKELSPLTAEAVGVKDKELPRFKAILQNEVQNVAIGEIETVDVKLGNVLINLESLSDPDLYPELLDKARLQLLLEFGNKRVGAVVAKLFQEQKSPSRPIQFTEEEMPVKEALEKIMKDHKLFKDSDTIKQYFQDGLKPFAAISNILSFAGEIGALKEVEDLRKLLVPSPRVVEVFNRFGEEFKISSGAMAVAQDLNYLDNLILKRSDELTGEERALLVDYVKQIREQLVKLEDIYEKIKNKFASFKQSASGGSNQFLKDKLADIDRIINDQSTARVITSTMTHNFNGIIENIRECLSCRNAGCNNDTNLTFGDENKFFIYSQTKEKKEGSVADQIVFVEPVKYEDGTTGLAMVLDRMYGNCTPDIFLNHLKTVLKKYRQLKKAFPDSQVAVVIPEGIFSTGGVSLEALQGKLADDLGEGVALSRGALSIDVIPSATGDHYVEFGGGARVSGERSVNSIILGVENGVHIKNDEF